ncbi:hypothetical protein H9Q69_000056 [Fusarium xylarioides]|uniref:Uncharacterized protein n=1 Tax=Fusarium xylarioides TaxID=221167 RepID=A0A9P7HQ19_9HYPO|nr:hypothetical protein H9Q70_001469 [Fusarium xylarioides]KAG5764546.1 hypothetical protein H9Q72_007353 [Fusarium xylarioides]KAG5785175.1 hypothetical protein H9Q73_001220 [Fusarium xylarioides]KAG5800929.1 hypothetical protein H9Q69_000056 [Fusarium xylarioides]KAG5810046.1 hypothetical protein H9Q71_005723 [Fusarium xylarioides]
MSSPKDPITAAYYPELAKIINNDPTAIERLEIECGMCQDKMSNPEDKTCSAIIFPCGHMFCPSCVKEYREYNRTNGIPYKCPVCRCELKGKVCGCPGKDTFFEPTQHQDEDLLDRLQKEISKQEDACVFCQMSLLANGLRNIALYIHDPAPLIKDGHMLRVRIVKRDDWEVRIESDCSEEIKLLPISSELMGLFRIAGDSLAEAWDGPRAPGDDISPFDFQLALCKAYPEDNKYWPHRRGQLEYFDIMKWRRDDITHFGRLANAREDALELAKAFTGGEAYKRYRRDAARQESLELTVFDCIELEEEEMQLALQRFKAEHPGLYILAGLPVVGWIAVRGYVFGASLARRVRRGRGDEEQRIVE